MIFFNRTAQALLICGAFLSAAACKTRDDSQTLQTTPAPPAPPVPKIDLASSGSAGVEWKTSDIEPIEVITPKDGLAVLEFEVFANSTIKLKNIPKVKFYEAANPSLVIAEGDLFAYPSSPGYYTAKLTFDAKASSTYIIELNHHGELTGGGKGSGSAWGNYYNFQKPTGTDISMNQALRMNDRVAQYKETATLKVDVGGPVSLNINAGISPLVKGLVNNSVRTSTCGCELTVTLTENGKAFPHTLKENGGSFRGILDYDLPAGDYPVVIAISKLNSEVILNLNASLYSQSAIAKKTGTLGTLQLSFDQRTSKEGKTANKPYGFEIYSESASEGKIEISMSVKRFINKSDPNKTLPDIIRFGLLPGFPPTSPTPIGATGLQGSGNSYNGSFIWDWAEGKYALLARPEELEANDIISLNGNMLVSDLTIKDFTKTPAPFTDLATVTATPAADYAADTDAKATPFPAKAPGDLAMQSVLAAFEQTRNVFHQRVPKGVVRGPLNALDYGVISACLSNEAAHWSDLMIHYYCQHGQARACYTNTVRSGKTRVESFDLCKTDPAFKWIANNQADIFRYIMFSQTFAYNMEQQQDVINRFYRVELKNPAYGPGDRDDIRECQKKRPVRYIDPSDGTHCSSKKTFSTPMQSAGR